MWGSDFPASKGRTRIPAALQATFAEIPADEVRRMVTTNAVDVYGFDLERLAPVAERVGPTVGEVMAPLVDYPDWWRNVTPAPGLRGMIMPAPTR